VVTLASAEQKNQATQALLSYPAKERAYLL